MSKITIDDIKAQFASVTSINLRFKQVQDEFNNKILYRDEDLENQMEQDLDMGGNDIINVKHIYLEEIFKDGEPVIIPDLTWGNILGDIEDQADLYAILTSLDIRITENSELIALLDPVAIELRFKALEDEDVRLQEQINSLKLLTAILANQDPLNKNHIADSTLHRKIDDDSPTSTTTYSGNKIETLVRGSLSYRGTWDALANVPALSDATGITGHYYVVSVAGTQDLGSGPITFAVNDRVTFGVAVWEKAPAGEIGDATQITYDPTGNAVITDPGSDTVDAALTDLDAEFAVKEDSLGNPIVDGDVLASTIAGARSWVTPSVGPQGPAGTAATITVGTVTELATGTPPTVVDVDPDPSAATFDFGLPTGATGLTGNDGLDGADGADSTVAGPTGPQGPKGDQGDAGTGINLLGVEPVLTTTARTALAVGDSYVAEDSGLDSEGSSVVAGDTLRAIDILVPSTWVNIGPIVGPIGPTGAAGTSATIAVGTVTAVPTGQAPTVVDVNPDPSAATFDFGLTVGEAGAQGIQGVVGPEGPASTVPGPAGADGADGAEGAQGIQGIQGIQGVQGDVGPIGTTGSNGRAEDIGSVKMWPSAVLPAGWIELNGTVIDSAINPEYADLIEVLNPGQTTATLVDSRGQFARGWSNGGTVDPARALGDIQLEEVGPHSHTALSTFTGAAPAAHSHEEGLASEPTAAPSFGRGATQNALKVTLSSAGGSPNALTNAVVTSTPTGTVATTVDASVGLENRPTNFSTIYIIKAFFAPDETAPPASTASGIHRGDTPPGDKAATPIWFNTSTGKTFTWYDDIDSGQWVQDVATNEAADVADGSISLNKIQNPAADPIPNWTGRVLTGAELTSVGIIGANPVATLWPDGSVTGSSDNGIFTKHPNGTMQLRGVIATDSAGNGAALVPIGIITGTVMLTALRGDHHVTSTVSSTTFPTRFDTRSANIDAVSFVMDVHWFVEGQWK